jgi:hypothetical protein
MVRRIPRIPIATINGGPQLLLSNDDWQRLEKAYGFSLRAEAREQIVEATRKFLISGEAEVTARPLAEASQRVEEIRKSSVQLRNVLINHPQDDDWDARHHAHHLINRFLNYGSIEDRDRDALPDTDPLDERDSDKAAVADFRQGFLAEVGSLIAACDRALKCLEEKPGPTKGDAWDQWICRLSAIAEEHQLPNGARKISFDEKPSPFVAMIWELQTFVPKDYLRTQWTPIALTEAITRARRVT